jgi:hypothetical protein
LTEKFGMYSTLVIMKLEENWIMHVCLARTKLPFGSFILIGLISL